MAGGSRTFLLIATLVATVAHAGAAPRPAATAITSVSATAFGREISIRVRGNGALVPSAIGVSEGLPPRILLDFAALDVTPAVPRSLDVARGDVRRLHVEHGPSSRGVRVVVELARAASFALQDRDVDSDEVLLIVAPDDTAAPLATPFAPSLSASPAHTSDTAITAMGPRPPPAPFDLPPGSQVKVEGHRRGDGSFDAVQVVLRNADDTVKIEGRVETVRADRRGLSLLGFEVDYGRDLLLYRGSTAGASRAELSPGAWIEVKGRRDGGRLVASRIRIKDAAEPTEEIESRIEARPAADVAVVLGRSVRLPAGVVVIDERSDEAAVDTRLRRDDDEQARAPWRIGSRIVVGGRAESAWVQEGNYDLATAAGRRNRWLSRVQLLGSVQLSETIEGYGKVSFYRTADLRQASLVASHEIEVQEAYLTAHRVGGLPLDVQVGRQRFRDGREWFYDEYMDAVRATVHAGALTLEGALSDGVLAGDPAGRDERDHRHLLASATARLGSSVKLGAFLIDRDDRSAADDDPRWSGATLDVKRDGGTRAWALGALRRGHRGATALGGWAADLGATVAAAWPWQPSLTASYAFSSGDTVAGDGRDTRFRQTDLEDNSARAGGLRRLTYYGELLDPELSNLQVVTVGLGARPRRNLGLDLVAHRYIQTVLRASLPSSALDVAASGTDGRLGHEVDLALTLRSGRLDLDLATGVFVAGPGIATPRRVAFFWRPQLRVYF